MKNKHANEIVHVLIDSLPNFLPETFLISRLPHMKEAKIKEILAELIKNDQLEEMTDVRTKSGGPIKCYRIKNSNGIPIKQSIRVGDVEIPRMMGDSHPTVLCETMNEQIQRLAEYSDTLEKRFTDLVKKEQRKYWANLLGIFGAFISIIALIIVGLPKIITDTTLPFWDIVRINLSQLLPLSLVLALLVIVLRFIIK